MRSRVTKDFRQLLAALPAQVQQQADEAYALFQHDPHHPSLHFKQITGRTSYYSARVGLRYRVLGYKDGDDLVWFWIGTHADYDKFIAHP
ncbi:MAG: hypothetical protein OJF49_002568 [Ktedonobacterales bacterium]|jgi:hypothetical protein|nr:MAG: hypothetical protein OJF49_002568 [Ktedonobacterales bacterium]